MRGGQAVHEKACSHVHRAAPPVAGLGRAEEHVACAPRENERALFTSNPLHGVVSASSGPGLKECLIEITVDILGDPTGSDTPCRGKRHHRGAIPERGTTQEGASL